MFNDQLSLLAAAIASGTPGSGPNAAFGDLVGSAALGMPRQQQQQQQQRLRRGPDPEWQVREAADTLLAAAAEMHRPPPRQQQNQAQLQQLLGRPQQQMQPKPAQRGTLAPHQQSQLDGMLAALSGEVADEDLENVAQALLVSYPDLSQQLLQLQSQPSRQMLQQQQQQQQQQLQQHRHQQAQQQQLIAALLDPPQQQQQLLPSPQLQPGNPSHQELIEQLVRGLMQPDPEADSLEAQLLQQQQGAMSSLLGRSQGVDPAARLRAQRQAQAKQQQEQDLLLQLGMNPQQQQPQQQMQSFHGTRPQQPGLLQLLQQQHAQQRSLQAITESFKSGSAISDLDMEASHGYMGPPGGSAARAAAAAAARGVGSGGSARPGSGKGKRKGSGTAGSGSGDPLSPISPATAAALAPPPEALAAIAAVSQGGSGGLTPQQQNQQQLARHLQKQQHQQQHAGLGLNLSEPPQDVYTAAASMAPRGGKPASALAAAAAAAVMPDLLPEPTGLQQLGMLGLTQQGAGLHSQLTPQLQQQLLMGAGVGGADADLQQLQQRLSGAGSPAGASSTARVGAAQRQHQQQQQWHQVPAVDDDMGGDDDDGDDDDDLLPPPGLVNLSMPPVAASKSTAAAAAAAGQPLSMRAKLGLPPLGLVGPLAATALPGGLGEQGLLSRPALTLNHHVVFLWDADDTLVPLHSLVNGQYSVQAGGGLEGSSASALGRKLQGLVLQLADAHMHFKELEDVDTVQIGDVWYLAAQYEQHRNRRRHAQQQQQQQERQDGMANGRSATPPSHAAAEQQQQQPLAKRARHDTHQQQQLGTSTSPPPDRQSTAAGDGANAGTPKGAGKRGSDAGHKQQQQRDKHAGEKTGAGSSRQPGTTSPTQASAAAAAAARGAGGDAAGGELVLRPYKLGPAPDKLQQLWDDIAKVYDAGSGVLPLPKASVRSAEQLYESLDAATSGWLRSCRALLDSLSAWPDLLVTHVVVGGSQLVPLLAKLLLARLDSCVGLTQVYSASAVPKVAAFQRVKAKYGPRARYIALGSGFEEEAAAAFMGWPFVRVILGPQDQPTSAKDGTVGEAGAAAGKGAGSSRAGGTAGSGAAKRQKPSSGDGRKGDASSDGEGDGEEEEDDDSDDDDSTDTDEGGGGDGGRPKGVGGKGADGRVIGLDALGSRGHTMMELTAQQLKSLAMTMALQ